MFISKFTIAFDTREQLPYSFRDMRIDRRRAFVLTQRTTLSTGDYSIAGWEDRICVERKSLEDLYGTLGNGRERFVRELERMQEFDQSLVVIEASWNQIMKPTDYDPLFYSQMNPASVIGSIVAFAGKYPKTRWKAAGDRRGGEQETFRFLCQCWKEGNESVPLNDGDSDSNHNKDDKDNHNNDQTNGCKAGDCANDQREQAAGVGGT